MTNGTSFLREKCELLFVSEGRIPFFLGNAGHDELALVAGEVGHSVLNERTVEPEVDLRLSDGENQRAGRSGQLARAGDFHVRSIAPNSMRIVRSRPFCQKRAERIVFLWMNTEGVLLFRISFLYLNPASNTNPIASALISSGEASYPYSATSF